jgi:hypothetical protein
MGVRSDNVRKVVRGGKPRWVIDFRYRDKGGREQRYRRDAHLQTSASAHAEAGRLVAEATATGSLELRAPASTFATFVDAMFRPMCRHVR